MLEIIPVLSKVFAGMISEEEIRIVEGK